MGIKTGVEWTNATQNFWKGCDPVSAGCQFCYMFSEQRRYGQDPTDITRCKDATFYAPLKWKEPKLIFTCSWSDFFIKEADAWRADAWDVIRRTPWHTWQILTKRSERIAECLPPDWGDGWDHVWMGVTAENQKTANKRVKHLRDVPARVRFLSCEPLLSGINLEEAGALYWDVQRDEEGYKDVNCEAYVDWVICGGESGGKQARPMHINWARDLRDQCESAQIPFFFKQWGEWLPDNQRDFRLNGMECDWGLLHESGSFRSVYEDGERLTDSDPTWRQGEIGVARVHKKRAGRLLDEREWNEMPEVSP